MLAYEWAPLCSHIHVRINILLCRTLNHLNLVFVEGRLRANFERPMVELS